MKSVFRDLFYVMHMLECIDAMQSYFSDKETILHQLENDDKTYQATLHRLQTLGESARHLDKMVLAEISTTVPWQDIIDFRSVLVHDYLGIEIDVIAGSIENDLPHLKEVIVEYLEKHK